MDEMKTRHRIVVQFVQSFEPGQGPSYVRFVGLPYLVGPEWNDLLRQTAVFGYDAVRADDEA